MTGSDKSVKFDISVVIPALNGEDYLPNLLKCIEAQTLLPSEIVIVDSSSSSRTADLLRAWKGPIPIVLERVASAYPGHARNVGVKLANGEWIAFLDCRTIPSDDWLESSVSVARQFGVEFVGALCTSDADTHFKQTLRAATHGFGSMKTLVGSIVLKKVFEQTRGFIPDVRAGEDVEWMSRLKLSSVRVGTVISPTICYVGFVNSLPRAVAKWCKNNFAITDIEVRNNQKYIYLLFLIFLIFLAVFNWNPTFAPGEGRDPLFVPNITKIFVVSLFSLYLIYRGVVRPLQVDAKWSFLLPLRWLEIALVGLCLDLAKAPGLIWGAILLLKRRISRGT